MGRRSYANTGTAGGPFGLLVLAALYLLLRSPGQRRGVSTVVAAFLLGVSALLWPVGLVLLAVLLVVLLGALLIRRAGVVTVVAALLAGAAPGAAYSAWLSQARAPVQRDRERRGVPVVADDVVRELRGDQAAGRRAGAVPADGTAGGRVAVDLGRELAAAGAAGGAFLGPDQPARAALRAAGHRGLAGRVRHRGGARRRAELLLAAGPPAWRRHWRSRPGPRWRLSARGPRRRRR